MWSTSRAVSGVRPRSGVGAVSVVSERMASRSRTIVFVSTTDRIDGAATTGPRSEAVTTAGATRRTEVLERAMHVASVEGLEGLTFGRLATGTGETKSALQALFGTREQLQLAILGALSQLWDARCDVRARPARRPGSAPSAWSPRGSTTSTGSRAAACSSPRRSRLDARPEDRFATPWSAPSRPAWPSLQAGRLAVRLGELAPTPTSTSSSRRTRHRPEGELRPPAPQSSRRRRGPTRPSPPSSTTP